MENEIEIKYPATWHVHWPNRSGYMCDVHKANAENLASVLGFILTSTASVGHQCLNCVYAKKSTGRS